MGKRPTRLNLSRWPARLLIIVTSGLLAFTCIPGSHPAEAAATATIWGSASPERVVLGDDTAPVELGTRFSPTVDGAATGVRFFKVRGMSGEHTGTLWSSSGRQLAQVRFQNETASGWQSANFSSPVKLTAGSSYLVSYHVPAGGKYGITTNQRGSAVAASLAVNASGSGYFTYSNSVAFPRSTWRSSQYWADVTFAPSGSSAPTTPPPTTAPTPSTKPTTPSTTPPSSQGRFPTRDSAGLPDNWKPLKEQSGDLWVRTAGAVVEDIKISKGTIYVAAPNVTLRRIQSMGGKVINYNNGTCYNGLVVEDSEFLRSGTTSDEEIPVISHGGYTARNIVIDGAPEGLRVGGASMGCGPVTVENSYIKVTAPDICSDWHGDGIQGYDGAKLTVRNTTITMTSKAGCGGTAPFYYPTGQGNTAIDVDGLLLSGGGYSFRDGMPGPVKNLNVVDGAWGYGPVNVKCSAISTWQAQVVKLDSAGQPTPVRPISCTGSGT